MYPPLQGIEERYGPTPVHLQVYDGESLFILHRIDDAEDDCQMLPMSCPCYSRLRPQLNSASVPLPHFANMSLAWCQNLSHLSPHLEMGSYTRPCHIQTRPRQTTVAVQVELAQAASCSEPNLILGLQVARVLNVATPMLANRLLGKAH